jgi:hypothetical protein
MSLTKLGLMTDRITWTGYGLAQDGSERIEAFIGRKVMDVRPTLASTTKRDKVVTAL